MMWKTVNTFLVSIILVNAACAYEPPFGQQENGLQATVTSTRQAYQNSDEIILTLTITNVSDAPIEIDPWPGNWFVHVSDENWKVMPHVRASDVLRPMPKPTTLRPGERWDTTMKGLSLTSGLPGSTPDWAYEPLKPGKYWIGAHYLAQRHSNYPQVWSGDLNPTLIQIQVGATESSASVASLVVGEGCRPQKTERKIDKVYRFDGSVFSETNLFSDRYNGFYITYHNNGGIDTELRYKDGELIYNKAFDEKGNPIHREGLSKTHYANGNLYEEINYRNDIKNGLEKIYYYDGKTLVAQGNYWNNRRVGKHKVYDESGHFIEEVDRGYPTAYVQKFYKTIAWGGILCVVLALLIIK